MQEAFFTGVGKRIDYINKYRIWDANERPLAYLQCVEHFYNTLKLFNSVVDFSTNRNRLYIYSHKYSDFWLDCIAKPTNSEQNYQKKNNKPIWIVLVVKVNKSLESLQAVLSFYI